MTEQERKELREVRIESQLLKDKIYMIETELKDIAMEIRFLNDWKKGHWLGPFLATLLLAATSYALAGNLWLYYKNSGSEFEGFEGALVYTVSSTVISFLPILFIAAAWFFVYCIRKNYMEFGRGKDAARLAEKHSKKNYYACMKRCRNSQIELQKALVELKMEKKSMDKRLNELAILEIPWDERGIR